MGGGHELSAIYYHYGATAHRCCLCACGLLLLLLLLVDCFPPPPSQFSRIYIMTTLNAADAVAIHKALHTKPIPAVVSTTIGTLSVLPNKYGNGSVRLWPFGPDGQLGPTMVGANPNKESSYARKMRAGGAVTLINPLGSLGYEARCIVLESLTPSSEPTVASGLHFGIKGLLQGLGADLNHAVEDAAVSPVNLNVGDKKRMYEQALHARTNPLNLSPSGTLATSQAPARATARPAFAGVTMASSSKSRRRQATNQKRQPRRARSIWSASRQTTAPSASTVS